jgi:hypothetical protein
MLNGSSSLPMNARATHRPAQHPDAQAFWLVGAMLLLGIGFQLPRAGASSLSLREQASQQTEQPHPSEIAVPLPKGKKLILSDGTFQIVREYHREGDRVRYYSLERSAWEEIPATLVDWSATQKAETEQDAQKQELAKQIAETEKAARFADLDVDTSFEVRPGTFLPDNAGFYALDGNRIDPMQQEKAEFHTKKGRAIAKIVTGVPLISSKQDMEIAGKQAKLRLHTGDAEFYFRTADKREPHLTLLRAEVKGEKRTVAVISTNIAGQQTFKNREVSLLRWDAARGLYRYTVDQPLEAGEYAIIETTPTEGQSVYVWTFGVDVPANPKPAAAKRAPQR